MKKKLALLLSAVMVATMVPMTAFAASTNSVDRIVTGKADTPYTGTAAPKLILEKNSLEKAASGDQINFELSLVNAEWSDDLNTFWDHDSVPATPDVRRANVVTSTLASSAIGATDITVEKLTATLLSVKVKVTTAGTSDDSITVPLYTTLKGEGDATVTINPLQSIVSSGTYKFANVAAGATVATIEKLTDIQEGGTTVKPIILREAAGGSIKNGTVKLKLTNGFEFTADPTVTADNGITISGITRVSGNQEVEFVVAGAPTTSPARIIIDGIKIAFDDDDVDAGDIAEITLSGSGVTRQTLEVGTARSYGVSLTAENKTLPTFIAGRADSDVESLKLTFKEVIEASWLDNRKTEILFPEGVKVDVADAATITPDKVKGGLTVAFKVKQKDDTTVLTINASGTRTGKVEIENKFKLSIDPGFTGDIVVKVTGSGVQEDLEATIGTVIAPVTVEAETNKVKIDYRNVEIGDIIIKETEVGNLERNKTLYLDVEEMRFDGTPTVEVVEGDLKIDKVKVNKGTLEITVKSASSKTPAVLKVTENKLYLDRTLPAGKYALSLVKGATSDAIFQNYHVDADDENFDTDEVEVLSDFIEVVTAGRDQDDSTFTTQIVVTIGADKLVAGDKDVALDVPAYISEGYTMLPVRAVTEALSGSAIVRWDDATKTVTITFGQRVVNMTVGSKTMVINGVNVQMAKACEITGERAFIPLRDLGYALGLNDSKINWDDETKTATLN